MYRLYLPFDSWSVCPESSYVLWERVECVYLVLGLSLAQHLRSHFPFQVTGFDPSRLVNAVNTLRGTLVALILPATFQSPDYSVLVPLIHTSFPSSWAVSASHLSCLQSQSSELSWVTSVFLSWLLTPFLFSLPVFWFVDHFLQDSSWVCSQTCLQLSF